MLPSLTRHHRVVLASVRDPELERLAATRGTIDEVYDAAAAEQAMVRRRRTAELLRAVGLDVVDADAERLPPPWPTTTSPSRRTGCCDESPPVRTRRASTGAAVRSRSTPRSGRPPIPAEGHALWVRGRDELFATHPASPLLPEDRERVRRPAGARPTTPPGGSRSSRRAAEPEEWSVETGTDGTVVFERIGVAELAGRRARRLAADVVRRRACSCR